MTTRTSPAPASGPLTETPEVWISVATEWNIKRENSHLYHVNVDYWVHGVATKLINDQPVAVLGWHKEYYGSSNRPMDAVVLSTFPIEHLDAIDPMTIPATETVVTLPRRLLMVSDYGDIEPIVALSQSAGRVNRYLVLTSSGRLEWKFPMGKVAERKETPPDVT